MIGFLFSMILLVLLGMIVAYVVKKKLRQINKDASVLLGFLIMGLFWTFGVLFYLNILNFGVSGRELMWNFPFNLGILPAPNLHLYAVLLFLSYPLWYAWGMERGYTIWGRRPYQEGSLYLFRMNKPGEILPGEKEKKKEEAT